MLTRGELIAVIRELVDSANTQEATLVDVLDRLAERATTPAVSTGPKAKSPPETKPTRVEANERLIPRDPPKKPSKPKQQAVLTKSPAIDRAQEILLSVVTDNRRYNAQVIYDLAAKEDIKPDTVDAARRRLKMTCSKTGCGLDTVCWVYRTANTPKEPIRARQVITPELKARARQLRSEGFTLKEISETLGLGQSSANKGKLLG